MSLIYAHIIHIFLRFPELSNLIHCQIKKRLRKNVKFGQIDLPNELGSFDVTQCETITDIYEYLTESNEIKITNKKTGISKIVANDIEFASAVLVKIVHNLTPPLKTLFGLADVRERLATYLTKYERNCKYILCGPNQSGKTSLLKNLEIELKSLKFYWLSDIEPENKLKETMCIIEANNYPMVICYKVDINKWKKNEYGSSCKSVIDLFYKMLKQTYVKVKIIISVSDMSNLPDNLIRGSLLFKIPLIDASEKFKLLNHIFGNRSESEMNALLKMFKGFTAGEIVSFFNVVRVLHPELRLDQLQQCIKEKHHLPSRFHNFVTERKSVFWSDIGGYDDVKALLQRNIVNPIKSGEKTAKGVLFHGRSGCGKSLFSEAVATECGVPVFEITPSKILSKYYGDSERKLKEIFDLAVASAPSILLIDTIDNLFSPQSDYNNEISVIDRLLQEILVFLDGANTSDDMKVLVVATASKKEDVDYRLIRPGRISEHVKLDLPDQDSIQSILKLVLSRNIYGVSQEVTEYISKFSKYFDKKTSSDVVKFAEEINALSIKRKQVISVDHVNEVIEKLLSQQMKNVVLKSNVFN